MTDQLFTAFKFKAAPGDANQVVRTMPDRLNDYLNVKDYGAKGDGVTDDTDAINAAIDYAYTLGEVNKKQAISRHGAIIFFPPGIYIIGKSGTTNLQLDRFNNGHFGALSYFGSGRDMTILRGNYSTGQQMDSLTNGFLVTAGAFQSQVLVLSDLAIENLSTDDLSGGYMSQSGPLQVTNCRFKAVIGLYIGAVSFGSNVRDSVFECSRPITSASAATRSPNFILSNLGEGSTLGSFGLFVGQGVVTGCVATGLDVGFAIAGFAARIVGCKAYRCGVGICGGYLGGDPTGGGNVGGAGQGPPYTASWSSSPMGNWTVFANWCDRCTQGMYVRPSNSFVVGNSITGDTGPTDPATIDRITWLGGVATATTHVAHNLPTGPSSLVLVTNATGWTPGNTGNEIVTCTRTGATTFTYALSANPGGTGSGTWNYSLQYGISGIPQMGNFFAANALDSIVSIASFDIGPTSGQTTGHNTAAAMRGSYGWSLADSRKIAGWKFIQCGTVANHPRGVTFAELPPQPAAGQVPDIYQFFLWKPVEGDEFNVTDCAAQANFAGIVAAGGSTNHYKLRFDGTNWRRIG
jgi:Pectate lyase superfamily protein